MGANRAKGARWPRKHQLRAIASASDCGRHSDQMKQDLLRRLAHPEVSLQTHLVPNGWGVGASKWRLACCMNCSGPTSKDHFKARMIGLLRPSFNKAKTRGKSIGGDRAPGTHTKYMGNTTIFLRGGASILGAPKFIESGGCELLSPVEIRRLSDHPAGGCPAMWLSQLGRGGDGRRAHGSPYEQKDRVSEKWWS